jgi:predicted ribosomally synthesized peptide with SipW-like signal peptide
MKVRARKFNRDSLGRFKAAQPARLNFNFAKKSAAIALVFGLLLQAGGLFIPTTKAYFNDTETSTQNSFAAGSLDINLNPAGVYSSGLMYPADSTSTSFTLSNIGSLGYNYISKIELLGSNQQPCDYVTVTATSTTGVSTSTFSSLIKDFVMPTSTPSTDVNWQYNFNVATDTPPTVWGKTCFFKWVYTGWQNNLSDPSQGFNDTEEKSGSIRIGKAVVLNEFLPNPTGLDDALKPGGEWVELYNNSNREYDLGDWYVFDNTDTGKIQILGTRTNTGGTTIAPHNWLVVYRNGSSAFVLNDDADSVRLFTGSTVSSTLVDSYSYTEEKPEGFSFARIPDGVGSWVDPVPTPGQSNITDADYEALVLANMSNQIYEITASPTLDSLLESTPEATTTMATTTAEATVTLETLATTTFVNIADNPSGAALETAPAKNTVTPPAQQPPADANQNSEKVIQNPPAVLPNADQSPAVEPQVSEPAPQDPKPAEPQITQAPPAVEPPAATIPTESAVVPESGGSNE